MALLLPFQTILAITVYEPDLKKMTSWTDSEKYPEEYYEIDVFGLTDYLYYTNWDVRVNNSVKGKMILMRPKGNADLGRTFSHPTK